MASVKIFSLVVKVDPSVQALDGRADRTRSPFLRIDSTSY